MSSTGRKTKPEGTAGSFDVFQNDNKVCQVRWYYPWGYPVEKNSFFGVFDIIPEYKVSYSGDVTHEIFIGDMIAGRIEIVIEDQKI